MMAESKLTNFQRKQLSSNLRDGKSLPVTCGPTSSQKKQIQKSATKSPAPKVMTGRHMTHSGKRKKETIEVLSEQNSESYRPTPGKHISEKDKRKLQNKMSYGVDIPDVTTTKRNIEELPPPTPRDEFDEILEQIEERREFLSDMEKMGQGKQYRTLIETEISQKIHDLELIDKKRTKELEEAVK